MARRSLVLVLMFRAALWFAGAAFGLFAGAALGCLIALFAAHARLARFFFAPWPGFLAFCLAALPGLLLPVCAHLRALLFCLRLFSGFGGAFAADFFQVLDALFAYLLDMVTHRLLALLDALLDFQSALFPYTRLFREEERRDRPVFRRKGKILRRDLALAILRLQYRDAFVDHVVGARFVAVGVLDHGGFMVGAADAYGGGRRGDAIAGRVVFAYPAGDGAYRSPDQGHENFVAGTPVGPVLVHAKHGVLAYGDDPAVHRGKMHLAVRCGADGLLFVDLLPDENIARLPGRVSYGSAAGEGIDGGKQFCRMGGIAQRQRQLRRRHRAR